MTSGPTRWDYAASSGHWSPAVVDSEAGGHYGECYVTPKLEEGAARWSSIYIEPMLSAMCLPPDRGVSVPRDPAASTDTDDCLWVPSQGDSTIGLEVGGAMGDTYHAMAPAIWVDRKHGKRTTVYTRNRTGTSFAQIAFGEQGRRMLIATEYEGGRPAVVDMRTGKVLLRVERISSRAVWVPSPR